MYKKGHLSNRIMVLPSKFCTWVKRTADFREGRNPHRLKKSPAQIWLIKGHFFWVENRLLDAIVISISVEKQVNINYTQNWNIYRKLKTFTNDLIVKHDSICAFSLNILTFRNVGWRYRMPNGSRKDAFHNNYIFSLEYNFSTFLAGSLLIRKLVVNTIYTCVILAEFKCIKMHRPPGYVIWMGSSH